MRYDVNDIFARCVDYNTKTYMDFFRFETINEYEYVTGDEKISVNESSYNKYENKLNFVYKIKFILYFCSQKKSQKALHLLC